MFSLFPDNALSHAVERAMQDADYRARLTGDPIAVLREAGVVLPDGPIKVVENAADTLYLPLPPPLRPGETWETALERMAQEHPFGDTVQLALSLIITHLVRFAKAWSDPAFRARLATDPDGALAALDAQPAETTQLKMVRNVDVLTHLVLPPANP